MSLGFVFVFVSVCVELTVDAYESYGAFLLQFLTLSIVT